MSRPGRPGEASPRPRHGRIVLRHVGGLLLVPSAMAVVSLPVAIAAGEPRGAAGFAATAALAAAAALVLRGIGRGAPPGRMFHAALATASGWLAVAFVAAGPFLAWTVAGGAGEPAGGAGVFAAPSNALFEAFSGMTGTGLTVVPDPSLLPRSLQWWRSLSEWVGGLGIVVAAAVVLRHGAGGGLMYRAEGREERLRPSLASTVRIMGSIYVGLTAAAITGLLVSGRPAWEAVNHGLTSISTGGFTITADSAAGYGTPARLVLVAAMIAGAIGFHAHHALLRPSRWREFGRQADHRVFLGLLVAGGLAYALVREGTAAWTDPVFQWTSALTTSGLSTADPAGAGPAATLLLVIAMTIGGEAGATVGGIKIARVVLIARGVAWTLRDIRRSPHELVGRVIDGRAVDPAEADARLRAAALLAGLWIGLLALGTLLLAVTGPGDRPLAEVLFEAASAQGNVGLSVGITAPDLAPGAKAVLCLLMWLGRLEILPVAVLVSTLLGPVRRRTGGRSA